MEREQAVRLTQNLLKKMVEKDGSDLWTIVSTNPIMNDNGEFMGALGMITDITERKKDEEQIKKALKEKEVLLKEIHHRVKNNMAVISSLLKLQANKVKDEQYREMFNDSMSRIKTMAFIHEKLYQSLDLSSINFNAKSSVSSILTLSAYLS